MIRIAIAGFQHETNTFAPGETTLDQFTRQGSWPALTRGKEIFQVFEGLNIPISGEHDEQQDVTGGIFLKLDSASKISKVVDNVWFIDGREPERVLELLNSGNTRGTQIVP